MTVTDPLLNDQRSPGESLSLASPGSGSPTTSPRNRENSDMRQAVKDLPDLTDRLKQLGIHAEYLEWRDNYFRWRLGEASGAKGENTVEAHAKRITEFEHWYPTVKTFTFRRTLAFWASVLFMEGCLLFLWVGIVGEYNLVRPKEVFALTKVPLPVAGAMFTLGVYMAYFELINVDSDVDNEKLNFVWCDWKTLLDLRVEWYSVVGAWSYLGGVVFYSIAQISDLFDLRPDSHSLLVEWPYIHGGFLFAVGGCFELVINRVFTSPPTCFVWWVSVLNFAGGVCFWLSSLPSIMEGALAANTGIFGTASYLIGSLVTLWMWRGEQFGGALIPAMNRAQRGADTSLTVCKDPKTGRSCIVVSDLIGGNAELQQHLKDVLHPKLSWRGLIFLNVYVFIAACQIICCCACLPHLVDTVEDVARRRFLSTFISGSVNVIIVHMILMLNSVAVKMPSKTEQPYRGLMILMRLLSLVICANSVLALSVLL